MAASLWALRFFALIGLAGSMAAWLEQLWPQPLFCGFDSDCVKVAQSAGGVPVALLGVLAFAGYFFLTLMPVGQRLLTPLAVVAALVGLALLLVQIAVLDRMCQLCLIADGAGMMLGFTALAWPPGEIRSPSGLRTGGWVALAAIACVVPLAWAWLHPGIGVPDEVRRHWKSDRPTVVLVTDFECEACRETHPTLQAFLRENGDAIHFVQIAMPLPKHPNAKPAARAYHCAGAQAAAMSEALFHQPDLAVVDYEKLAEGLGLDRAHFTACFNDPGLDARIEADTYWVRRTGAKGLPIIWIHDRALAGVQTMETLNRAWQHASQRFAK